MVSKKEEQPHGGAQAKYVQRVSSSEATRTVNPIADSKGPALYQLQVDETGAVKTEGKAVSALSASKNSITNSGNHFFALGKADYEESLNVAAASLTASDAKHLPAAADAKTALEESDIQLAL